MTGFGAHQGHTVYPHNHAGQDLENRPTVNWCSKRWLCLTCAGKESPRGVWFDGPACPRPPAAALNGRGGQNVEGGKG